MREILFRGRQTDKEKWIYGVPVKGASADESEILIIESVFECDEYACRGCEFTPVIPSTVGQYTGLTDKNGRRIFEGDIVAGALIWQEKRKNGLVAFKYGSFGLMWYRGGVEQFNAFTSMCNIEYEVIGNIHDNPELLKGDKSDA